jgi:DNA-binding CsgD family transcriptional regulator
MSETPRKRWDRMDDAIGKATERRPPFPTVLRDVIWLVMRIDRLKIAPFVPAGLAVSLDLIGVLGFCEAVSGSAITPFVRAFGGVAIEGHDSPDTKEAVYIVGDVVTEDVADVMRQFYVQTTLAGEPRIWRDDGLLHGAIATSGKEWLRVAVRPTGRARSGVTGLDAYLGTTERGLNRHIVSYLGALAPAEVVSCELGEDAPPAVAALRPTDIGFALRGRDLHATWGEPHDLPRQTLGSPPAPQSARRDPLDVLRSMGLTPAEARLAALIGKGFTARSAAQELRISEHTARSTLKQVYGKLGIRKQAELGHFIARVQFS